VSAVTEVTASATKPEKSEFLPYYERYIGLVPDGDVLSTLTTQMAETQALLRGLPASVAQRCACRIAAWADMPAAMSQTDRPTRAGASGPPVS